MSTPPLAIVRVATLLAAVAAAGAAEPPRPPPLAVSDDGSLVVNLRTRVAWSRCVEGMRWTGKTCAGTPLYVDHAGALALAAARREHEGGAWRLPRVTELQRLAGMAGDASAGLDARLFPGAPDELHWTSTANLDGGIVNDYDYDNIAHGRTNANANRIAFLHGWAANPGTGLARGDIVKRTRLPVRLLRSLD